MPKNLPDAETAVEVEVPAAEPEPEADDTVYAVEPDVPAREDYPVGVIVFTPDPAVAKPDVPATAHVDGVEYKVDPETGRITGPA